MGSIIKYQAQHCIQSLDINNNLKTVLLIIAHNVDNIIMAEHYTFLWTNIMHACYKFYLFHT